MNPIKWVFNQVSSIFKFFIDDLKQDANTIKKVSQRVKDGKPIFSKRVLAEVKEYYLNFDFGEFLKEYWMGILFCILCGVVGWYLASVYYESQCNIIIQEALNNALLSNKF